MTYEFPINLVGHDQWIDSGWSHELASGDVVTSDGEVIGVWCVAGYDLEDENSGGYYQFFLDGREELVLSESFAILDSGSSTGYALSNFCRKIREWHEAAPS